MLNLQISGDQELRKSIIGLAQESGVDLELTETEGFDGEQIIRLVLDQGPQAIALATAIIQFIGEARQVYKNWSINISSEEPKRKE